MTTNSNKKFQLGLLHKAPVAFQIFCILIRIFGEDRLEIVLLFCLTNCIITLKDSRFIDKVYITNFHIIEHFSNIKHLIFFKDIFLFVQSINSSMIEVYNLSYLDLLHSRHPNECGLTLKE
jgi:hypothetical protein